MAYVKAYWCDYSDCDRMAIATCPICDTDVCKEHGDFGIVAVVGLIKEGVADPPEMPLPGTGLPSASIGLVEDDKVNPIVKRLGDFEVDAALAKRTRTRVQLGERRICVGCYEGLVARRVFHPEAIAAALAGSVDAYRAEWSKKALEK